MSTNVFTYGSLMFREVLDRAVIGRYQGVSARAHGFTRGSIAGQIYPGMIPDATQEVAGTLYFGIEPDDLARLDFFEGEEYERSAISVACEGGRIEYAQAYIYLFPEKLTQTAWIPKDFDLPQFLRTYCHEKFGT